MALSDLEGDIGMDRALQPVDRDLSFLRQAIDVDLQALRFTRGIVRDEDVVPFIGLDRSLGDDLERILIPLVDEVRGYPAAFKPYVPPAVVVAIIHSSNDGAWLGALWDLDPGPGGKCLISLEVSGFSNFVRASRYAFECPRSDVASLPGHSAKETDLPGPAVQEKANVVAFPLAQAGMEAQIALWDQGGKGPPGGWLGGGPSGWLGGGPGGWLGSGPGWWVGSGFLGGGMGTGFRASLRGP